MRPYDPGDTSIISPGDNVPVGACWTEGRNAAGPGLTSFSAVRRINKRRRTVSGPRFQGPPSRRRSFVLANRTRVPARPFRKNARNVQSYNARSIGLSFWILFPFLLVLLLSRDVYRPRSLSLPLQHPCIYFLFLSSSSLPLSLVPPRFPR